ncbi:MAG: hypothetical protein AAGJ73_14305 [Pseudomonadota bacterium]
MKLLKFFTMAATAGAMTSAAYAGEWADQCMATLEAEGRDASGCQCLEDAITADEAMVEEFMALGEIADPAERYAAASDDAKAIMDSCTRS